MINNKISKCKIGDQIGIHLILREHEMTLKYIGLSMILICSPSLSK
jgi:hypothetical protein